MPRSIQIEWSLMVVGTNISSAILGSGKRSDQGVILYLALQHCQVGLT